jgi:hypothetical protein
MNMHFKNQRSFKFNYLLKKKQYKHRIQLQSFKQFYKIYKNYNVSKVKLNLKKKHYIILYKKFKITKRLLKNYVKELNLNGICRINDIKHQKTDSKLFRADKF